MFIKSVLTPHLVSVTSDCVQLYSQNLNLLSATLLSIYDLGNTVTMVGSSFTGFEFKISGENISIIDKDILCDLIKKTHNDINFFSNKLRFLRESIIRLEIFYAKPYLLKGYMDPINPISFYGENIPSVEGNTSHLIRFHGENIPSVEGKPRFSDMILEAHNKMYAHHINLLSHMKDVD